MSGYMHLVDPAVPVSPFENDHKFISGFVTDTRLMGVVCLYMEWLVIMPDGEEELMHQYYYYEAEESGIESYHNICGADDDELAVVEQSLIGGLGGCRIALTEKEAVYVLQRFAKRNREIGVELPAELPEFQYLLDLPIDIDDEEIDSIIDKMCVRIESPYQAVNYFLMRFCGRDYEAMGYLAAKDADIKARSCQLPKISSLEKNTIEKYDDLVYLSQSIISDDICYRLMVSEIVLNEDLEVVSFRVLSLNKISDWEAAMNLTREEFVTTYRLFTDPLKFQMSLLDMSMNMVVADMDESQRLLIAFRPHNEHVNRKEFRLSDDVHGMYCVTFEEELLIVAYNSYDILSLEHELLRSPLSSQVSLKSRYSFHEPVFYDFLKSGIEDFDDFVALITGDE